MGLMNKTVDKSPISIEGVMIREIDISKWNDLEFKEYFIFAEFFYKQGKIIATEETAQAAYQYAEASAFIGEMLTRINRPIIAGEEWNRRQFYMRLNSTLRTVNMYMKKHPEMLLQSIVIENRMKTHCQWMNDLYDAEGNVKKVEEAPPMNLSVVEGVQPASVLLEAMQRVANVYNALANSITEADIKKLDVKDRISALQKLSYIHTSAKKFKPNLKFTKINIKTGSKEELEEALLDFNNDDEE